MNEDRERFLQEMAASAPSLAEQMGDEIERAIPVFAHAGPDIRSAQRGSNLHACAAMIDLMYGGEPASDVLQRLVRLGIPPMDAGIGLDEVMHAYRIAAETFWRYFERCAGSYPGLDKTFVLDAAVRSHRFLNELSTAVARRYLELQYRALGRREEAERAVVEALVGTRPRFEEATRAARGLQVQLTGNWSVAVAELASGDQHPPGTLAPATATLRDRLRRSSGRIFVTPFEGALVVVMEGAVVSGSDSTWDDVTVGFGRVYPGPQGIRTSYGEAREALTIALRKGLQQMRFEDAWLDRFFLGMISADELSDAVLEGLRSLPSEKRKRLEATLEAYLDAGGSVTRAARALHLHPQSLRYRLSVLQKILAPLGSADGRLALAIAIKSSRLFADQTTRVTSDR